MGRGGGDSRSHQPDSLTGEKPIKEKKVGAEKWRGGGG